MATISLANFPDELYERLARRAEANQRRVDDELVEAAQKHLEQNSPRTLSVEEKLRLADSVRMQTPNAWITEGVIRAARDEGRA
jgi:hypothetical protein